jgi:hypothetical protein
MVLFQKLSKKGDNMAKEFCIGEHARQVQQMICNAIQTTKCIAFELDLVDLVVSVIHQH